MDPDRLTTSELDVISSDPSTPTHRATIVELDVVEHLPPPIHRVTNVELDVLVNLDEPYHYLSAVELVVVSKLTSPRAQLIRVGV